MKKLLLVVLAGFVGSVFAVDSAPNKECTAAAKAIVEHVQSKNIKEIKMVYSSNHAEMAYLCKFDIAKIDKTLAIEMKQVSEETNPKIQYVTSEPSEAAAS